MRFYHGTLRTSTLRIRASASTRARDRTEGAVTPPPPYDLPGDPSRNPLLVDLPGPSRGGRRLPCPRRRGRRAAAPRARPARTGWRTRAGTWCSLEKKHFPREKTCGDGLTPRSVRQLGDMGLSGGPGRRAPLRRSAGVRLRHEPRDALARSPVVPVGGLRRSPVTTSTSSSPSGPPRRARRCGREPRPSGRSSIPPPPGHVGGTGDERRGAARAAPERQGARPRRRTPARGAGPLHRGGRRGELTLRPGARYLERPRLPDGHGAAGLLPLARATTSRSSSPTSTSATRRVPSFRVTAGSSPSATGA